LFNAEPASICILQPDIAVMRLDFPLILFLSARGGARLRSDALRGPARSDCDLRRQGDAGHNKVARELGVGTGTVQRIVREMGGPFDAAA
jgi:hypothetical protein